MSQTPEETAARVKGYATLRHDVMRLADELNEKRKEMVEMIAAINIGITKLAEFADHIFAKAVNEYGNDGHIKTEYRTKEPSPDDIAAFTNPSSRKCSNCGEPGHTAPTCTNERKEPEPKAKVEEPKRKMKPLSPERKAQLAETLKKAREARAKKGKSMTDPKEPREPEPMPPGLVDEAGYDIVLDANDIGDIYGEEW